jgi:hypothetical protein
VPGADRATRWVILATAAPTYQFGLDALLPIHVTSDLLSGIIHALFAGLVAIRYLWPVWLVVAVLWIVIRLLRAIGRFFGFPGVPAKPTKPLARPRR